MLKKNIFGQYLLLDMSLLLGVFNFGTKYIGLGFYQQQWSLIYGIKNNSLNNLFV
jgi:hypothetical protein